MKEDENKKKKNGAGQEKRPKNENKTLKFHQKLRRIVKTEEEFKKLIQLQERQIKILEKAQTLSEDIKTVFNLAYSIQEPRTPSSFLPQILGHFGENEKDKIVLNVYQTGSRCWGSARFFADWDFMVVVDCKDPKEPISQPAENNVAKIAEDVDTPYYTRAYWEELLRRHIIWALVYQYYPKERTLLESFEFDVGDLELWTLFKSILHNKDINVMIAKRKWQRADIRKSKKQLIYFFRYLNYALTISLTCISPKIVDFASLEWKGQVYRQKRERISFDEELANQFSRSILLTQYDTWENLSEFFEKNLEPTFKKFDQVAKNWQWYEKQRHKEWVEGEGALEEEKIGKSVVLEYVKQFGLNLLLSGLALQLRKVCDLLYFVCTPSSPSRETSLFLCDKSNGLVFERNTMQIVCWPFPRPIKYSFPHYCYERDVFLLNFEDPSSKPEKFKKASDIFSLPLYQFDWENKVECFPFSDTLLFSLFFHNGKWRLILSEAPNKHNYDQEMIYDYFWSVWEKRGYKLPPQSFSNLQFQFVMCSDAEFLPEHSKEFLFCARSTFYSHKPEEDDVQLQSVLAKDKLPPREEVHLVQDLAQKLGWKSVEKINVELEEEEGKKEKLSAAQRMMSACFERLLNSNTLNFPKAGIVLADCKGRRILIESELLMYAKKLSRESDLLKIANIFTFICCKTLTDESIVKHTNLFAPDLSRIHAFIRGTLQKDLKEADERFDEIFEQFKHVKDPKEFDKLLVKKIEEFPEKKSLLFLRRDHFPHFQSLPQIFLRHNKERVSKLLYNRFLDVLLGNFTGKNKKKDINLDEFKHNKLISGLVSENYLNSVNQQTWQQGRGGVGF